MRSPASHRLKDMTRWLIDELSPATPTASLEAAMLLQAVTSLSRTEQIAKDHLELAEANIAILRGWLTRRQQGEPMAYILGSKEFYGREFVVDPRVLIPRPETEQIIDISKDYVKEFHLIAPQVLDIGTGSGCIAITIALECPGSIVEAWDISADALGVARHNARTLGASLMFSQLDALSEATWQYVPSPPFHLIVSNPPYIARHQAHLVEANVVQFEPSLALFSQHGLEFYETMAVRSGAFLKPGGQLVCEIGFDQGEAVANLFRMNSWSDVEVFKDLSGHDRIVRAGI